MAFTEFHYYSETLEIDVSVNVILPETRIMAQREGKPLPTLYLLHGLSDDHTHWVRQTRLEFYARKYRLAIIMPCVNRSFYTDMKRGAKYFTFVSEELPRVMEMYFPLSSRREDRFAAGLSMGGYGAVFWLWMAALLGMVIKYSEVLLAVKYRERDARGDWVGGPMYYIKNGMGEKWKWLAGAFSVLAALAAFGIGNMSQANSIVGSVTDAVCAVNPDFSGQAALRWGLGIGLALLTALVLFGGIKRIGAVTEKLIPFMSVAYILMTLIVIFGNLGGVGRAFKAIFSAAFAPRAILGGAAGITIRQAVVWGLRRSAFSNEAGLGSAPIAHAAAHCDGPVEQGIYGIFEVFMDTIVICTLTALTIIISGVDVTFGVKPGSALITAAFGTVFNGTFSSVFIAVALTLFAYSTILGWSLYGSRCVQYLLGLRAAKVYQFIFIIMIVVGSVSSLDFVWNIADTLNGLMAIPNFIALFALSPVIFKITREYFRGVDLASAKHE